jgi:UDP-N-acetylglucosamine--N-acetylmuramyl-(pentapeptide) pyrophosphoryl-undecaprenol N-acetylglucosamine transferase
MPTTPHVLFAGGGSASHLHPGMAIAEHLRRRLPNSLITFAGSGAARERHKVRLAGYQYTTVPAHGVPRNPLQAVRFVTDNVAGYCAARWMLREQRVSLVVGLGGTTSVAVIRAAAARGIPIVLVEQNAVPSRASRWLSRAAVMVCAAFEEVRPHLHVQAPVTVTGNPTRRSFEELYVKTYGRPTNKPSGPLPPEGRDGEGVKSGYTLQAPLPIPPHQGEGITKSDPRRQRRLVILGGSGGGRSLNESVPAALQRLGDNLKNWQIVHQTGDGQLAETESRYNQFGVHALTVAHIDEIASVLFASDLAICRAGGTTLAELALAGLPALLLPFPNATDNHQLANAQIFSAAGAARLIDEREHAGSLDAAIARSLEPLLLDSHQRDEASRQMHKLARPQAASQIAASIADQLCGGVMGLLAA